MHTIKKYANRKLYDTIDKSYVTMERIAELVRSGEEVEVIDNATGRDITASIFSRLLSSEKAEKALPTRVLSQLLRKGSGSLVDHARRYTAFWQNALTMAEDEIERFVSGLVRNREISKSEGGRLKKDVLATTDLLKSRISERIDQQVKEVFDVMNLATRDQIRQLDDRLARLERQVQRLERVSQSTRRTPASPRKKQSA